MKRKLLVSSFLVVLGLVRPARAADTAVGQVPDLARLNTKGFSSSELERIRRGFRIAPVPLRLQGRNLALVGLGSYFVNALGGCNDCHTNPSYLTGGDPFLGEAEQINAEGYLAGGTAFGPFISRNLTPDANGRPAGLTRRQFSQVLRTGVDLKGLPPFVPSAANDLLQVMPWPVHRNMIDRELDALYEYLRSIPSRPGYPQ